MSLSIFALTLIPLLSATGAAVDYSYAFRLRTITQDALDAAALAGGRMIGVNTEAEIKTEVDKFFISNVANRLDTIPSVSQAISGATITLNTTLDVPTHFLKVIGLDDFHFPLSSQVTSGIGTLEVAIVVDTSGSMAGSKLTTLKTAATNLTTTLFGLGTTSTKPDPIKIGLVPFAGSVNVGSGNSAAAWMDTTHVGTYHGDAMDGTRHDRRQLCALHRDGPVVGRLCRNAADSVRRRGHRSLVRYARQHVRADVRARRARQLDLLDQQLHLCRLQQLDAANTPAPRPAPRATTTTCPTAVRPRRAAAPSP